MKKTAVKPRAVIAPSDRDLLDDMEAAKVLGVAAGTLSVWRSTGRYNLPFVKVGRSVRYRRADLDAWLDSRFHADGKTS